MLEDLNLWKIASFCRKERRFWDYRYKIFGNSTIFSSHFCIFVNILAICAPFFSLKRFFQYLKCIRPFAGKEHNFCIFWCSITSEFCFFLPFSFVWLLIFLPQNKQKQIKNFGVHWFFQEFQKFAGKRWFPSFEVGKKSNHSHSNFSSRKSLELKVQA